MISPWDILIKWPDGRLKTYLRSLLYGALICVDDVLLIAHTSTEIQEGASHNPDAEILTGHLQNKPSITAPVDG